MDRCGISIRCLQEAKVAHTTRYVAGELLYVLRGGGGGGYQQEHAGVGVAFNTVVRDMATGFELN